jgi:hypothetical protein
MSYGYGYEQSDKMIAQLDSLTITTSEDEDADAVLCTLPLVFLALAVLWL